MIDAWKGPLWKLAKSYRCEVLSYNLCYHRYFILIIYVAMLTSPFKVKVALRHGLFAPFTSFVKELLFSTSRFLVIQASIFCYFLVLLLKTWRYVSQPALTCSRNSGSQSGAVPWRGNAKCLARLKGVNVAYLSLYSTKSKQISVWVCHNHSKYLNCFWFWEHSKMCVQVLWFSFVQ